MNIFSDPNKIVDQLTLLPGEHIADLGAGSGGYTLAIARKLKGRGNTKVFSVDVQKPLLERISSQAEEEHLESIHTIWGDIEVMKGTRLRDDSVDLAIIANTLFQVEDKKITLKEAYRILKPGGRLLVIDWAESFGNIGPKDSEVLSFETAKLLCEETGFSFDHTIEAGEHHYGFINRKI